MLSKLFLTLGLLISLSAIAETVDMQIKDIEIKDSTSKESGGAIVIRKEPAIKLAPQYEITQGDEEITADPAPLLAQARTNWKKSCADWKKELKENNQGNQVISSNCGSMMCAASGGETTCKSKANYKVKIKVGQ
ncbi:MAG: hypothetical protein AABY64_11125 [Bdellovibrionota bacterium]